MGSIDAKKRKNEKGGSGDFFTTLAAHYDDYLLKLLNFDDAFHTRRGRGSLMKFRDATGCSSGSYIELILVSCNYRTVTDPQDTPVMGRAPSSLHERGQGVRL